MNHFKMPIIYGFCLWMFSMASFGIEVRDLFRTRVVVDTQTVQTESAVITQGMRQVLIKVAGSESILQAYGIADALKKAQLYVVDMETLEDGSLDIHFSQSAIRQLLQDANVPVWNAQRPLTLIWLVVNDEQGRRILNGDSEHLIKSALDQTSSQRGVPILWPLMDIEDTRQISASDVWGGFVDPIAQASERYAPDAILVGAVSQKGESWSARWKLIQSHQQIEWDTPLGSGDNVAKTGISRLAEQLSAQYARPAETVAIESNALTILVDNIDNDESYARLYRYLEGLNVIQHFYVKQYEKPTLTLSLFVTANADALQQAISLDRFLTEDGLQSRAGENVFFYHLGQSRPE